MVLTSFFDGFFAWIIIITVCFCLGDVSQVSKRPIGYPYMTVFLDTTQSTYLCTRGATAMAIWNALMFNFCNLTMVATTSRQLARCFRTR